MTTSNNGKQAQSVSKEEEERLLSEQKDSFDQEVDDFLAELTTTPPSVMAPSNNVSSLDFERIVNEYSIQAIRDHWLLSPDESNEENSNNKRAYGSTNSESSKPPAMKEQHRRLLGYTGRTATRWALSALAGLLTGLTSIFIVKITSHLVKWRSQNLQSLIIDPAYSDMFVLSVFSSLNLAAALSSSWLCVAWAPQAAGSGISQVKAYLNGIRASQKFTRLPLFVVKVVGTILSVSSSLAIGMEGPLIHIGAIMGASCTKFSALLSRCLAKYQYCGYRLDRHASVSTAPSLTQRWLSWTTTELSHFATDAERRDLVSIGASCGFAASFGAPIGGLLFILDDISSYFNRSLLLRMLVANAIGTFCLAVQHGDLSNYSVISLGTYTTSNGNIFFTRIVELPLYLFMGTMGGILGGVFCASFMWLRRNITDRLPARGHGRGKWELLEVAMLSLLTSVLLFYLPSMNWACKDRNAHALSDTDFSEVADKAANSLTTDEIHRNRFFCPQGQVNELGNILFGSRIEAIKRILTDPTEFRRETLLTVGILFYVLMNLTFGTTLPSGIFTPSVLIGASLGGAAGITFQEWFGSDLSPSTFALLGVAALLAGIQRSTVSLCVILVEGTGQIKVLMPAIITVVVARYVASLIHEKGIFEAVMDWKHLPYLDHEENKRRYDAIQVCEIMSDPPMETVRPTERAKDLVDLLQNSSHNGFPVVDPTTNKFLGLVRRDQIAAELECGVFERSFGRNCGDEDTRMSPGTTWTRPQSGVESSPLMRWAYHINDDRYDYVLEASVAAERHSERKAPRYSIITSPKLLTTKYTSLPTEFATIGMNEKGVLVVVWFNPDYGDYYVNLGAVMNRGTFCVRKYRRSFSLVAP